jgi:hypothetical protein
MKQDRTQAQGKNLSPMKKSIGKGHTLFDHSEISRDGIWILIAESCYEISKSLYRENAYATECDVGFASFEQSLGGGSFILEDFTRTSEDLFRAISSQKRYCDTVDQCWTQLRRIMVRVHCAAYIEPLFYVEGKSELRRSMLEGIRLKLKQSDLIGVGLEGCRFGRPKTYTPSRSEEHLRAKEILGKKPKICQLYNNFC